MFPQEPKRRLALVLILIGTVQMIFLTFSITTPYLNQFSDYSTFKNPIRIGVVTCIGPRTEKDFIDPEGVMQVITLVKSVLISAHLHKVKQSIEFHLFVDNRHLKNYIDEAILEFKQVVPNIKFRCYTRWVFHAVPLSHFLEFATAKGCRFVRLFFPYSLRDKDRILYLDKDIIVTGNIEELWNKFEEMGENQIASIAPNNEPHSTKYQWLFDQHFKNIPHVPPKGVNSGVMLMDLEKMRKFGWMQHVYEAYEDFRDNKNISLTDQKLVNIIFSRFPDSLKLLTCQFNFMHIHCDEGLTCKHAEEDPLGIQIVHGAGFVFRQDVAMSSSLFQIFHKYAEFDFEKNDPVQDLIIPLKMFYSFSNSKRSCALRLKSILFKNFPIGN